MEGKTTCEDGMIILVTEAQLIIYLPSNLNPGQRLRLIKAFQAGLYGREDKKNNKPKKV